MKISTRGRYGLRMLLDIAEHQHNGYVSLKDISERQAISKKYLEQIVPLFISAGFLRTSRGHMGGYMLASDLSDYSVADVLRVTEGGLAPVSCLENGENRCAQADSCDTLFVWQGLMAVMENYLEGITLRDILSRKVRKKQEDYVLL